MKSFHSSHLLIHFFSLYSGQQGPPGLAPPPLLTSSLLPPHSGSSSYPGPFSLFPRAQHTPTSGFHTCGSLHMDSSSPTYVRGSHPHSLQVSAQMSLYQRNAPPGHPTGCLPHSCHSSPPSPYSILFSSSYHHLTCAFVCMCMYYLNKLYF